jgi:hypothetical protein
MHCLIDKNNGFGNPFTRCRQKQDLPEQTDKS